MSDDEVKGWIHGAGYWLCAPDGWWSYWHLLNFADDKPSMVTVRGGIIPAPCRSVLERWARRIRSRQTQIR